MSTVQTILLDDARHILVRDISPVVGRKDLHEAFAAWLVPSSIDGLSIDGAVEAALKATGAERNYQHVAVLGLATQVKSLSNSEMDTFASGLQWLVGREPVVGGTPMGFCMDPMALAAFMVGAGAMGDSDITEKVSLWIQRCRLATARGPGLGNWQECMVGIVGAHAGIVWKQEGNDDSHAAEVRVALRSRGIGGSQSSIDIDEVEVLNLIRSESSTGLGLAHATIRLAALDWIRRVRPVADLRTVTVKDICNILRRLPSGLKKWTWEEKKRTKTSPAPRKWYVDNEYHVQNILSLLLAPIFPDLVDEDATPKVGPVQPRADIGIPSLRVIVEAKFMRSTDAPKGIIEQIAEDASLYLVAGSKYDLMIPFVWDDSCRTEYHHEMIRGLRQIDGVIDAVIVSKPGSMLKEDKETK